jgi:hypothetical protein
MSTPNPKQQISREQYFKNREKFFDEDIISNATRLLAKVNILLADYFDWLEERDSVLRPQSAELRSGIRTTAENIEIYRIINARRAKAGLQPIPVATLSSHLTGEGIDLGDNYDLLKEYLDTERGTKMSEDLDLYFEHFDYTDTWVHATTRPPKSGLRRFKPY